jgi:hypothetical protein
VALLHFYSSPADLGRNSRQLVDAHLETLAEVVKNCRMDLLGEPVDHVGDLERTWNR